MIAQHISDLLAAGVLSRCLAAFGVGWALSSLLVWGKRMFESI